MFELVKKKGFTAHIPSIVSYLFFFVNICAMTNQSIKWMNCCFDKLFLNDRIVKSASDSACCVTCKSGFHSSPNVPFQIWGGQGRGQGDGHDFHSSPNAPFQIDHSLPILSWWFSHPPPYGDRSYLQSSLIVSGGKRLNFSTLSKLKAEIGC